MPKVIRSCNAQLASTIAAAFDICCVQVISCKDEAWCVPVCVAKSAKRRSLRDGVSSWLSSTFSRRGAQENEQGPGERIMYKTSCSFRITLDDEGYDWSEDIIVALPDLLSNTGSDHRVDTNQRIDVANTRPVYPSPSALTQRRRILIRNSRHKHKMLTYTIARTNNSIQILFFIDCQPSVVIHNQWQQAMGLRVVSSPSFPESVGGHHYMEYDWDMQV